MGVGVAAAPVDEVFQGGRCRAVVFGAGDDDGVMRFDECEEVLDFFGVAFFGFGIQRVERQVDVAQCAVGFVVAFDEVAGGDEQVGDDGFLAVAGADAKDLCHVG